MKDCSTILTAPSTTICDTIRIIDESSMQIALIVDDNKRLIGTVTDGDIRRGILKGVKLDNPVSEIMNTNPTYAIETQTIDAILTLMRNKRLRHIPVLDENNAVMGIEILDELIQPSSRENWVVLMAGGLGSRLTPLTVDCPKPLLRIGSKPILESILEKFLIYGFNKFYLTVNYKAEMIKDYFGDGSKWGVEIRYIHEEKRMGTAGALSLLPQRPSEPLVVMNGDLLTKVNFEQLLEFHTEHNTIATMCVREFDLQVPYGVVRVNKHLLTGIDEKPVQKFFVNAGIYVLEPDSLDFIPKDEQFDMPNLFQNLIKQGFEPGVFPIREYWLDVGRMSDFEKANGEFLEVFK